MVLTEFINLPAELDHALQVATSFYELFRVNCTRVLNRRIGDKAADLLAEFNQRVFPDLLPDSDAGSTALDSRAS
jgi:hypothetical protein